MDDERIERALRLGPVDEPAYQPQVARWGSDRIAEAAGRSVAGPTARASVDAPPRLERPVSVGVRIRRAPASSRRSFQVAIAASVLLLVGAWAAIQIAPVGPAATPAPSPDLLARLTAAGSVKIAVRDTAPQTVSQGRAYIGFDIDVARAIARQLGLQADVTAVAPGTISSGTWDLALPGPDPSNLVGSVSQPYAYWPAWLAVSEGSAVTDVASLSGARICVVDGSAGAGWLAGTTSGGRSPAPPGAIAVVTGSDDACVAALGDGRADALVTANLFSDELAARGLRPVVPAPVVSDPWSVIVRGGGADAASLAAAVDGALAAMRSSGELADLSRSAFGGRDVTVPAP